MSHSTGPMPATVLVFAVLSGCGGGGGGSGDNEPAEAIPVTAEATQLVPGDCPNETKQLFLDQINALRTAGLQCGARGTYPPVPPLVWSDRLGQAALEHSLDMDKGNYFAHVSPDGRSTPATRLANAGYSWTAFGENIAAGQPNVAAVVMAWRLSDGHCVNQMSPHVTEAGLSCVTTKNASRHSPLWTAVLARP